MGSNISEKVEELYKLECDIMGNRQTRLQWGDKKVGRYNALKREICEHLGKKPEEVFDFLMEIVSNYRGRLEKAKDELQEEYQRKIDEAEKLKKDLAKALSPYLPKE